MKTIEQGDQPANNEYLNMEHNEARFRTWLHILGNDEALTAIVHNQNILHADLQAKELVQKVVTDPIFQAFDTIYREEIEINPTCTDGDLRQIDQKFKGLAEQTCAAYRWVNALQTLKVIKKIT